MEKEYCQKCKTKTNVEVLYKEMERAIGEGYKSIGNKSVEKFFCVKIVEWSIYKCKGCEERTFKIKEYIPRGHEKTREEMLETPMTMEFYHPNISKKIPEWIFELDYEMELIKIISETYRAFNENLYILSSIGIRTIIDSYFQLHKIEEGSFKKNLEKLYSNRIISEVEKKIIKEVIDVGSAAAHRGFEPTKEVIEEMFSVLERLLSTDLLKEKSERIKKVVPKRK